MVALFRLFLILTLIAGTVIMAPSRGMMAGATQIEVCAGTGTQVLTLDARGNPVGPHHPCPDCTACTATGPLPDASGLRFARAALPLPYPLPHTVTAPGANPIHPAARDPPLPV